MNIIRANTVSQNIQNVCSFSLAWIVSSPIIIFYRSIIILSSWTKKFRLKRIYMYKHGFFIIKISPRFKYSQKEGILHNNLSSGLTATNSYDSFFSLHLTFQHQFFQFFLHNSQLYANQSLHFLIIFLHFLLFFIVQFYIVKNINWL